MADSIENLLQLQESPEPSFTNRVGATAAATDPDHDVPRNPLEANVYHPFKRVPGGRPDPGYVLLYSHTGHFYRLTGPPFFPAGNISKGVFYSLPGEEVFIGGCNLQPVIELLQDNRLYWIQEADPKAKLPKSAEQTVVHAIRILRDGTTLLTIDELIQTLYTGLESAGPEGSGLRLVRS